jgi:hypothetical protein
MGSIMKRFKGGFLLFVMAVSLLPGMDAWAGPGENIHIGHLTLSPFAEISGTYDDNVLLTKHDREEDLFGDVVAGLAFINRTEGLSLRGRGWYQFRRYDKTDSLDADGFGESLGAVIGHRDRVSLELTEKFVRLEDYEITPRSVDSLNLASQTLMLTEDRTERVKRKLFDVGALAGRNFTDKIEADLGYGFSSVNYETGELFDWDEHRVQFEGGYRLTEKTMGILTAQFSAQNSDGFTNSPVYYVVRPGFLYRLTEKTSVKAGFGVEYYDFGDTSSEGEDLDKTIFSFDVAGSYAATEKLFLQVSGRNSIQPATQYRANTKQVTLLSAGTAYDMTQSWRLSLAASFRQDDYIGRVRVGDELRSKLREHVGGRARVEYRPRKRFYDIYLETTYEDVDDNLEDDYENYFQWRVSLGVSLRY